MSLSFAIVLTAKILSFAMLLQAIEIYILSFRPSFIKIWNYKNLKSDLEKGLPMRNSVIAFIFSETNFKKIILVQIGLAAIGCFYSHSFLFFILFLSHLTICIRFRGSFNGGSDMMTFVILIGTLISLSSSNPYYQKMGMLYISINTIYSYFKSGLSKIIQPEWRNGSALPAFLSRSLFTDIQSIAHWLQPRRCLGLLLCWFVLVFELSSALLIFFNDYTYFYLCFSILFHFLIFIGFGLNRFFWIWLSAWPATVFILW